MKALVRSAKFNPLEALFFLGVISISIWFLTTPYAKFAILIGPTLLFLLLLGNFPQFGFYLIVFIIPFDAYTALKAYSELFSIPRFIGLWLIFILGLQFLLKFRRATVMRSNLWPLFAFFFLVSFLAAYLSEYSFTAYDTLRILLFTYIFFAMALIFITQRGFYSYIPKAVIASIAICSYLSVISYAFDLPLFAMDFASETKRRALGMTTDPNGFCQMIIFSMPLLVWWFFTTRKLIEKKIAVITFLVNILAVMLTGSRSGGITLALVLVLLFIAHVKRFKPQFFGFVGISLTVVITAVVILMPGSYWERQKSVTKVQEDRSLSGRVSFVNASMDFFKEAPVLGSGPGTFKEKYATTAYALTYAIKKKGEEVRAKRAAHNAYLEILVGQGLIGLILYLLLFIITFKNFKSAIKAFKDSGRKEMAMLVEAYRISFISIITLFLVLSLNYHKYFWLSLAISQLALNFSRNKEAERLPEEAMPA